jgi:hypothetical protein
MHARTLGALNYASSGNGTIVQLTAELFKSQAGLFLVHIPYKGTALAIPDLVERQGGRAVRLSADRAAPCARRPPARAGRDLSAAHPDGAGSSGGGRAACPGSSPTPGSAFYGPKGLPADDFCAGQHCG